jgi:hypothetical protein
MTELAFAIQQTEQAETELWAKLVEDGSITMNKGLLQEVYNFEESFAQRDWYQWWPFGYDLADFVIMTHVEWEVPENTDTGGCGFVFRLQDENRHLVIFVGGERHYVELGQMTVNGYEFLNSNAWISPNLSSIFGESDSADLIVAAEKEKISAYINGVKAYKWIVALTNAGDMGYTILSNSNKDFGISCKMTNTNIWGLVK